MVLTLIELSPYCIPYLLLLVVPAKHPAQVAAAVAGAAPEPEAELRCLPGPNGRISDRRKNAPTRRHGQASRRPLYFLPCSRA